MYFFDHTQKQVRECVYSCAVSGYVLWPKRPTKLLGTRVKTYHKIPKISPGLVFFKGPFEGLLCLEGNLRFKIDWPSLIVGRKFTVFALLYFAS